MLEFRNGTLGNVFGTQWEMKGSGPNMAAGATQTYGDEVPIESLSLNFAKLEISYQPQSSNGTALGGPIMAGWDLKANKKV